MAEPRETLQVQRHERLFWIGPSVAVAVLLLVSLGYAGTLLPG